MSERTDESHHHPTAAHPSLAYGRDLTDPDVLAALAAVHDRLAGVPGVVVDGEDAVALSPWTLLAGAGGAPTDVATITDTYRSLRASEPAAVSSVLAEDHRSGVIAVATSGTPAEAADLADRLEAAAQPLAAIGVEVIATSQDVTTASIHSSLADSQLRGLALTLGDAGSETVRALERTVTQTGRAVVASAVTTAAGFGALALSANEAIRQFGIITFVCVVVAAAAALTVQPAALALASRSPRRAAPADDEVATTAPERSAELVAAGR